MTNKKKKPPKCCVPNCFNCPYVECRYSGMEIEDYLEGDEIEGFVNPISAKDAKKVMKIIGANQNDYDLLVAKSFVIQFPDGICVIKHWRINNYLRKDRYTGKFSNCRYAEKRFSSSCESKTTDVR